MIDEESGKELKETNELMEPCVQSSSSKKMKIIPSKPKLCMRLEEPGVRQMSSILLYLQMASIDQLAPIYMQNPIPFHSSFPSLNYVR
jgi:hypothetical protein